MDAFKKQVIGYVISAVLSLLVMVIYLNITRDVDSNDSYSNSIRELQQKKADKTELIQAKRDAFLYTDKEVNEVKRDLLLQGESINKRMDDMINHQTEIISLLKELKN